MLQATKTIQCDTTKGWATDLLGDCYRNCKFFGRVMLKSAARITWQGNSRTYHNASKKIGDTYEV